MLYSKYLFIYVTCHNYSEHCGSHIACIPVGVVFRTSCVWAVSQVLHNVLKREREPEYWLLSWWRTYILYNYFLILICIARSLCLQADVGIHIIQDANQLAIDNFSETVELVSTLAQVQHTTLAWQKVRTVYSERTW